MAALNTLANTAVATTNWFTPETMPGYAQAAAALVAALVAAWLAYHYAVRQARRQARIQIGESLRARQANALQSAWQLLAYMSKTENAHSILRFDRVGKGANAQDHYYARCEPLYDFLHHTLPQAFYTQHAGLYWPAPLKDNLFSYRSSLYGFWLKSGKPESGEVEIINPELVKAMHATYDTVNALLRQSIGEIFEKAPLE